MFDCWSNPYTRAITERIVVEADLVLCTPAHFGNGETDDLVDMPLVTDLYDQKSPFLAGTSIAGALRNYLQAYEQGYGIAEHDSLSQQLFGLATDDGNQSHIIVDDALGKSCGFELRDMVRLDPKSRTAAAEKLFSQAYWKAGAQFPLRFELLVTQQQDEQMPLDLKKAFVTALSGLEKGEITLGARKTRGFGEIKVENWRCKTYDLTQTQGLLDWLKSGDDRLDTRCAVTDGLANPLGVSVIQDARDYFTLDLTCGIEGSVLIRTSGGVDGADMVHLHSTRDGALKPILSGTSIAGAMRAQGRKIARTLCRHYKQPDTNAEALIKALFGDHDEADTTQARASRLTLKETIIQGAKTDLVQHRIAIDRFTGGVREGALFNQQPAFAQPKTEVTIRCRLHNPRPEEIGLLLLLVKDIWTSWLPFGGDRSVGRGRLFGKQATLIHHCCGDKQEWKIQQQQDATLSITGDQALLSEYVETHLQQYLKGHHDGD